MGVGLGDKVALFLHLSLDLPLFQFYIMLFALDMLRHTLLPWLEPFAHLFRLATHGLRLERAA